MDAIDAGADIGAGRGIADVRGNLVWDWCGWRWGGLTGFLQSTATPVQVAAGLMVLQEAGGMSKWIDSADDKEDKTPAILLAANGEIFDPFCKLVLSND